MTKLITILLFIALSVSHSDLLSARVQLKLIPQGTDKGKVYLIGPDTVPEIFPLRVNFPVFRNHLESITKICKPNGLGILLPDFDGVVVEGIVSVIPLVVVFSFGVFVDISFIMVITRIFWHFFSSISKVQH